MATMRIGRQLKRDHHKPWLGGRPRVIWWVGGTAAVLILVSLLGQLGGPWSGPGGRGLGSVSPRDWLAAVVFTAIGARVAAHRPHNPIGWLFLIIGLSGAIALCSGTYAKASIVLAWIRQWSWWPAYGLVPLALLLFPDGRLPSRRWRLAAWTTKAGVIAPTLGLALAALWAPTNLVTSEGPLPLTGWAQAAILVVGVGLLLAVAGWAAAILGLVRRWRVARGDERQQVKWLLVAGAVALSALALEFFMEDFWSQPVLWLTGVVGVAAIPVAVGVAVLKYHLYAIDRLLNRALVYTLLSAILGLGYAGGVMVLRWLSSPLVGRSGLAVAGSTLAMAALFRPARRRIQEVVDRRFNRRRYDAAGTIEGFNMRLRHETDLDTITADLLTVVGQTMEPISASVWLRQPPAEHAAAREHRGRAR
jgi:MFS family permease